MASSLDNERLAAELLQSRDAAKLTALPSQRVMGFDVERGYAVSGVLHEKLLERGYQPVGRKIGLTNREAWERLQAKAPIWSHVYDKTIHFAEQGHCRLSLSGMVAPRIEAEVVLKLRRSIPAGEPTNEQLAECVEWAALGFEFVDCHFPEWRFTVPDLVADFGAHAALVVGTPWQPDPNRLKAFAESLQTIQVSLHRGMENVAKGEGRNVLGSPLLSLGEPAKVLATQPWAPPLQAGEIITTGTLTPALPLVVGETWRVQANAAAFQSLEVSFVNHS